MAGESESSKPGRDEAEGDWEQYQDRGCEAKDVDDEVEPNG
jgi:hypothetical protein